jgi:hypothetical protein
LVDGFVGACVPIAWLASAARLFPSAFTTTFGRTHLHANHSIRVVEIDAWNGRPFIGCRIMVFNGDGNFADSDEKRNLLKILCEPALAFPPE